MKNIFCGNHSMMECDNMRAHEFDMPGCVYFQCFVKVSSVG